MAAPSTGAATAAPASAAVWAEAVLDNNQGWYDEALWVNPRDSNHVVVGGVTCGRPSTAAATWQWISDGIHVDHHVIVEDPRYDDAGNRTVFFGNDGGVYKAKNIRERRPGGIHGAQQQPRHHAVLRRGRARATGTIIGGTQDNGTLSTSRCRRRDGSVAAAATAGSSRRMRPMRRISTPA